MFISTGILKVLKKYQLSFLSIIIYSDALQSV